MKKLFRIFKILIFLLWSLFNITANVKLSYVYWGSPAEDTAIRKALKDFEAAHPGITVDPMYISGDISGMEYAAKLRALAQAKQLPDLGYFRPEEFGNFAKADYFLDLNPYITKDNLKNGYLPQTWLVINDKTYGVFTAAECQVVFYNKDVLKKANVPLPPSDYQKAWSWDEYVKYAKMITEDANGKHPGDNGFNKDRIIKYGISYQLWHAMLNPPLWSNGGGIVSEDGKSFIMDSPASIEVIQKISDLINKDHVMPYTNPSSTSGAGLPAPSVMLANGQLGFYVTGQWELLDFGKMNFSLGVAPLPVFKKPVQLYISGASVIFKSTRYPKEAWELHKWMMTPDKTLNLYAEGLWMPTKESWYNDPADLKKWTDNPVHPEGYKEAVLNSMKVAKVSPESRVINYLRIWNECVAPQLDKVWLGEMSAGDAMKAAGDAVRKRKLLNGTY